MNGGRVHIARQEEPRLEERLIPHRLQELFEFHGGKLPGMASCRNGISYQISPEDPRLGEMAQVRRQACKGIWAHG